MKNIIVPFRKLHRITELGEREALRWGKIGNDVQRFQDVIDSRNANRYADESWQAYFEKMNQALDGGIAGVRCCLNDWARKLGVGLVSISLESLDKRGSPIDFGGVTVEHKAPTDGLICAIKEQESRVIAGFGVSHAGEEMMDIGIHALLAADSESPQNLMTPRPVDTIIIRTMATLQLALLDERLLRESGVSFRGVPDNNEAEAQRYRCRFLK